MAKLTSKYQVSVPKAIADQYKLRPGDDIEWVPAGDVIRVIPPAQAVPAGAIDSRLNLFDQATRRQQARTSGRSQKQPRSRGWTREELYRRGRAD